MSVYCDLNIFGHFFTLTESCEIFFFSFKLFKSLRVQLEMRRKQVEGALQSTQKDGILTVDQALVKQAWERVSNRVREARYTFRVSKTVDNLLFFSIKLEIVTHLLIILFNSLIKQKQSKQISCFICSFHFKSLIQVAIYLFSLFQYFSV